MPCISPGTTAILPAFTPGIICAASARATLVRPRATQNNAFGRRLPMSRKIAIVEDEAELAGLIEYNLTRAGFQPRVFPGEDGTIAALELFQPDLIVLDVMLPGHDGF